MKEDEGVQQPRSRVGSKGQASEWVIRGLVFLEECEERIEQER